LQPLCELVFEGNGMNNLVLTRRTFRDDFSASGSYLSADALSGSPNENVQRWVKLRQGMSTSEVISLLGQPPRRTYDSSIGCWVFDYGYGRVKIHKSYGLSHWRLN
jgi:hypothetical protein